MPQSPNQPAISDNEYQLIQPLCSIFRRYLKRQGLKFTSERAQILDAVLNEEGVFEADHLQSTVRRAGHRVSKATIYRTLKKMRDAGIINEVLIDSKHVHYELSFGRKPKGHLVCVETDQIIEFDIPELDAIRERVCKEHGFDPVSHRFIVYAISPAAKKQEQAE